MRQFSETLQAASSAAAIASSMRLPVLAAPTVHRNDVDQDDLPSSRSMELDGDGDSDYEAGIDSDRERILEEHEDQEDEEDFRKAMEAAAHVLGDIDLEDLIEVFDFLPNPDLEDAAEGEADLESSTASYHRMRRTLVDDDAQSHTYQWHPSAGRVYKQEETIHTRWRTLFAADRDANSEYKPFSSRLDWEIAQWAVKEKISQKSFNRLLKVPQVIFLISVRHWMLIWMVKSRLRSIWVYPSLMQDPCSKMLIRYRIDVAHGTRNVSHSGIDQMSSLPFAIEIRSKQSKGSGATQRLPKILCTSQQKCFEDKSRPKMNVCIQRCGRVGSGMQRRYAFALSPVIVC